MVTGMNEIVRLEFSNGMELRCTAGHRIFTANRGYVTAGELTEADDVRILNHASPATQAPWSLPVSAIAERYANGHRRVARGVSLPAKWSEELGHYVGWLVGDGAISGDMVSTVYGNADDRADVMPGHQALLTEINDGFVPKPSVQSNGTIQLRASRRAFAEQLRALGVSDKRAGEKVVPWSVYQAPTEVVTAFLRGLFDADGCVYNGKNSRYVGLGSASKPLLQGVQRLPRWDI